MKKANFIKVLMLLCAFNVLPDTVLNAQTFTAPFGHLADPHIFYHDGYYYYTGTNRTSTDTWNVSIHRATTIEGLRSAERVKVYGDDTPGGQTRRYWAPELFRVDGKWYLYYTGPMNTTSSSVNDLRMHCLENTSDNPLEGTWTYKGRLFAIGADYYAIDHTYLEFNGKKYVAYSGDADTNTSGPQHIWLAELTNPWTITGGRTAIATPQSGEGNVNEGVAFVENGNKLVLTYSAEGFTSPNYRIRMRYLTNNVAQTTDPLLASNWVQQPGNAFVRNDSEQVYGPGHHGFFQSPNGNDVWFVYHATPRPQGAALDTRSARAQKITFNSSDLPVFPIAAGTGIPLTAPEGEVAVPSSSTFANGVYYIQNSESGRLVEVEDGSHRIDTNVSQWENRPDNRQLWNIQATGEGFFTITARTGGLSLEVEDCLGDEGANVHMWPPNGKHCQQWSLVDMGNGSFEIKSRLNDKVLDLETSSLYNNGANVIVNTSSGSNQQKFYIVAQSDSQDLISPLTPATQGEYALRFDGSDDYVDLGSLQATSFSQGFTLEVWANFDDLNNSWSRIIDIGQGRGDDNIFLGHDQLTDDLVFSVWNGSTPSPVKAVDVIEPGRWQHFAATVDASGNGKVYVDGVLEASGTNINIPANLIRSSAYIGRSNWSIDGYFDGLLNDVRIWNVARTAAQISADKNVKLTGNESGLIHYFSMNEGTGTNIADSGSGDSDGTLTNGVTWVAITSPVFTSGQGLPRHIPFVFSASQGH